MRTCEEIARKVLREAAGPENRYKRERIYEALPVMLGWAAIYRLRQEMGDTDYDRDTRSNEQ